MPMREAGGLGGGEGEDAGHSDRMRAAVLRAGMREGGVTRCWLRTGVVDAEVKPRSSRKLAGKRAVMAIHTP